MSKKGDSAKRTPEQIERHKERMRQNYLENRDRYIAAANKYRVENREAVLAKRRTRYKAAHDHKIVKGREYAAKRTESGKAAAYRKKVRKETRAWSISRSAALTDGYVREMLAKNSIISAPDFPQELVEVKRLEIKLKRKMRNEKCSSTS